MWERVRRMEMAILRLEEEMSGQGGGVAGSKRGGGRNRSEEERGVGGM